jgi:hypothetical protein
MMIVRFLFALLLGFVLGAGVTLWFVQSGGGDLLIRRTDVVQDLERRLREVEEQRNALGRQLEDVRGLATRMESSFNDLERRFRDVVTAKDAEEKAAAKPSSNPTGEQRAEPPPP